MDLNKLEALLANLEQRLATDADRFLEIDAALTAQAFLLEVAFANAFISNPDGVIALTAQLAELTRTRATTGNVPMDAETRAELQARVAARLIRFGSSTAARIRSDPGQ